MNFKSSPLALVLLCALCAACVPCDALKDDLCEKLRNYRSEERRELTFVNGGRTTGRLSNPGPQMTCRGKYCTDALMPSTITCLQVHWSDPGDYLSDWKCEGQDMNGASIRPKSVRVACEWCTTGLYDTDRVLKGSCGITFEIEPPKGYVEAAPKVKPAPKAIIDETPKKDSDSEGNRTVIFSGSVDAASELLSGNMSVAAGFFSGVACYFFGKSYSREEVWSTCYGLFILCGIIVGTLFTFYLAAGIVFRSSGNHFCEECYVVGQDVKRYSAGIFCPLHVPVSICSAPNCGRELGGTNNYSHPEGEVFCTRACYNAFRIALARAEHGRSGGARDDGDGGQNSSDDEPGPSKSSKKRRKKKGGKPGEKEGFKDSAGTDSPTVTANTPGQDNDVRYMRHEEIKPDT